MLIELLVCDLWRLRRTFAAETATVVRRVLDDIRHDTKARQALARVQQQASTASGTDGRESNGVSKPPMDFGPDATVSDIKKLQRLVQELSDLPAAEVIEHPECVRWVAANWDTGRARGDTQEERAAAYMQELPRNVLGSVRNRACEAAKVRLQDLELTYLRQRQRRMSLVRHSLPSPELEKRERDLRRGIMDLLRELRQRRAERSSCTRERVEVRGHTRRPRGRVIRKPIE